MGSIFLAGIIYPDTNDETKYRKTMITVKDGTNDETKYRQTMKIAKIKAQITDENTCR